jgi:hypothetical protein
MKAFLASIGLLIVICIGASVYLDTTPMSSAEMYSTDSVRLN